MSGEERPRPTALRAADGQLVIEWDDGVQHALSWEYLRAQCPCASCVNRGAAESGELPILTSQEAEPVRLSNVQPMGNYAYGLTFSDGHSTGIYTLEHLRAIGEQNG